MWSKRIRRVAASGTATNIPRMPAQLKPAMKATMTSTGGSRTDQDRRHRSNERADVWDQRGDARDEAERDRVRQAKHPARKPAQDPDKARDDQLTAHVRVQHLSDAAPDLVEVGAVVIWHKPAQHSFDGCGVEREQEGDDEREEELQECRQRGEANAHGVAKLAEEVFPQVGVDGLGRAAEVDLETEDLDWRALKAVDAILRGCCQAGSLDLELRHLAYAERHHQEDHAGEHEDDDDEHHSDRQYAWQAEVHEAHDAGLDHKRDRCPKHERAEKVSQQERTTMAIVSAAKPNAICR